MFSFNSITLTNISSIMLNRSGGSGHLFLGPGLRRKVYSFTSKHTAGYSYL